MMEEWNYCMVGYLRGSKNLQMKKRYKGSLG